MCDACGTEHIKLDKRVKAEVKDALSALAKNVMWRLAHLQENPEQGALPEGKPEGGWDGPVLPVEEMHKDWHTQLDQHLTAIYEVMRLASLFTEQELEGWAEEGCAQWNEAVRSWAEETQEDFDGEVTEDVNEAFENALSDGEADFDTYLYVCTRCGTIEISQPDYWQGHGSMNCTPYGKIDEDDDTYSIVSISVHGGITAQDIWQGILSGP